MVNGLGDGKTLFLLKKKKKKCARSPGKSSQVLVLKGASPTRTEAEEQAMAEMAESGRQQMEKQIANTSVFTQACCSLY